MGQLAVRRHDISAWLVSSVAFAFAVYETAHASSATSG